LEGSLFSNEGQNFWLAVRAKRHLSATNIKRIAHIFQKFTMASFQDSKAYQGKTETFFDDGREVELLHFIHSKPDIEEIRDSPQKVLAAIDEYARTKKYLMNVGEDKGRIVSDLIAEVKPETMVSVLGGLAAITFLTIF